jgi:succinate-acetate transporter protein
MWDIALGNGVTHGQQHRLFMALTLITVFGGTALSTYGGFWISIGVILTPGGFRIQESYSQGDFYAVFGLVRSYTSLRCER